MFEDTESTAQQSARGVVGECGRRWSGTGGRAGEVCWAQSQKSLMWSLEFTMQALSSREGSPRGRFVFWKEPAGSCLEVHWNMVILEAGRREQVAKVQSSLSEPGVSDATFLSP